MNTIKRLMKNTLMLYLLSAAKMLFPFLTFPYLTRVLSIDGYALVAYVRAVMVYMQILVDFGFILSATKSIVQAGNNSKIINQIVSNTILARILLGIVGAIVLVGLCVFIPLLKQNLLFTWISYGVVFISCFVVDYLFRGLEKMHEITYRFVVTKGISTLLTFVFVHSDADLLYIPILDVLGSVIALILVYLRMSKYDVHLIMPSLKRAWTFLKESAEYFASSVATTAFGALNTLLIGLFLPETDVAIWAVSLQLISVVQMLYGPIIEGIYPEMMRKKHFPLISKILFVFLPLIVGGCISCYFIAPFIIQVVAGNKYGSSVPIFRLMIPVLFFSFPAMLCGWPSLGAIGKVRQTTLTTVISACAQVAGLGILVLCGAFTLPLIAIIRTVTESILCGTRIYLVVKYRNEFN